MTQTQKESSVLKSTRDIKRHSAWDVIVIGSGMGGMACAASLAKYGSKVLVFEQHYVPGGFTHAFTRKGYSWDVGVHCVGEMGARNLPGKLLRWLSDGQIQMKSMGPTYETFHFPDQFTITFPDSSQEFKKRLEENFPKEKAAISKYFDLVRTVVRLSKGFFLLRAMPEWVDQLASKTVYSTGKEYWERTTAEVLNELTDDYRLKAVLTAQWGYYGSIPSQSSFAIHALTVRHFWNGGFYPVGGGGAFAEGLLKTVSDAGGQTCVRTPIDKILIKKGKAVGVRTATGEEFFAKKVVSATGVPNTINHLLPDEFRTSEWGQKMSSLKLSPSYICLNLGFKGDIRAAGASTSNQWFFESWSMNQSVWDVTDPESVAPILYLSFPSLKDPSHDPGVEMKQTGEVVTFVPWEAFEKWKHTRRGNRDSDYLQFKKEIENRLIRQLTQHIPKLMSLVAYHEVSTPLSTEFFARAPQGAIYGLEATPDRFTSTELRTRTPIKNLYLAGGDVATLGVTGAMVGGVLAAGTINPRVFSHLF